jgi:hypothetical protein
MKEQNIEYNYDKFAIDMPQSTIFEILEYIISEIKLCMKEYDPKFVLLTRNPYAEVFRSSKGVGPYFEITSRDEKLKYASQHWKNSVNAVLEDKKNNPEIDILIMRFEDLPY